MRIERGQTSAIAVTDSSAVGEVRRSTVHIAQRLGFSEIDREGVAIVATELASNIVKHGGGGEVLVRRLDWDEPPGIELIAVDKGQGIRDVAQSMIDGFSTAGSPGTGLGAGSRLSTSFDVHSTPNGGTVVVSRLRAASGSVGLFPCGAVSVAKRGEEVCGDAWGLARWGTRAVLLVADGLGHGPLAAKSSIAAVDVLASAEELTLVEIVNAAHGALRSTRGAAVAVAELDTSARQIRYVGVGNISGSIITSTSSRQMVSHSGIVGEEMRRVQEFAYPWPPGARIILHSDGLATHWRLDSYPGLVLRDPSIVAAVLYRDFSRGRDDVTVVVIGENGP